MAKIGMRHVVFAPITAETPGSAVTYGTGLVVGRAVSGELELERNDDNNFYADDAIAESDTGSVSGGTLTVEVDHITPQIRETVLGFVKVEGTSDNPNVDWLTDAPSNPGGCGFIYVERYRGNVEYIAYWFPKVQFAVGTESFATKGESIEWAGHSLTGTLMAVYPDATGAARVMGVPEHFNTYAAAEAWLNSMAGVPA